MTNQNDISNDSKHTLNIGDRLYRNSRFGDGYRIVEIKRVTKTLAISSTGTRIKREPVWQNPYSYVEHGGERYFSLLTPKIEAEYYRHKLLLKVASVNMQKFSNEYLESIVKAGEEGEI